MFSSRGKKAYANTCLPPSDCKPPHGHSSVRMPILADLTKAAQADEQTPHCVRQYVLVTAAYNEEENIEKTIRSVLSQTLLPIRWVIVSDGSVDRTDEIINGYAEKNDFIRFLRVTRAPGRSFGSKVRALQAGTELLQGTAAAFIGNLDADVSLEPSYFEDLIARFHGRPTLGVAGGFVCEEAAGEFRESPLEPGVLSSPRRSTRSPRML